MPERTRTAEQRRQGRAALLGAYGTLGVLLLAAMVWSFATGRPAIGAAMLAIGAGAFAGLPAYLRANAREGADAD